MDTKQYELNAARTVCPQREPLPRLDELDLETNSRHLSEESGTKLTHAILGMMGEVGELASALEKFGWYRQPFDRTNVIEELGDVLWYVALACDAVGTSMEEVMELNIAKLRKRFPEKYTDTAAAEENRDRTAERDVLEGRRARAEDDGPDYSERDE